MEFLDIGASHVMHIDRPIITIQSVVIAEVGMSQSRVQSGGTSRGTEKVHSSKKEACSSYSLVPGTVA